MRSGSWTRLTTAIIAAWSLAASAQTNGIFADFTTSMGNFTCQLSYSNSPLAVANFIGLATGQRAWLNVLTGEMRTNAFYDGLIFHRVIAGFIIQGGSPNGQGTDDPGYAFVDQFNPLLTFSTPWILAMANSGPDSNGSQFFVTVEPYTYGNSNYVVFGRVVSGTNVVTAINKVATDPNTDKPLTNVVIQHVSIRSVGAAAQAFDITTNGLPIVTNLPVALLQTNQALSILFSNRLFADNRLYSTTNLSSWTSNRLGIELSAPSSNTVPVAMDAPDKFFRFAQIQYGSTTLSPKNVLGETLTMYLTSQQTNIVVFDTKGGGTFNLVGTATGTVTSYSWSQGPYRAFLLPISYSTLYDMDVQLNFTNAKAGSFSGTYNSPSQINIAGTFTLTP